MQRTTLFLVACLSGSLDFIENKRPTNGDHNDRRRASRAPRSVYGDRPGSFCPGVFDEEQDDCQAMERVIARLGYRHIDDVD